MECLKFDIYGKYAFFKNPENNIGVEFSFEHIHKPCLLGILGCILGLDGKDSITKDNPYPEYYKRLKDIKVSIVPNKPIFNKFKETTTNTMGFANKGFAQVLNREVLQNVRWTIHILKESIDKELYNRLYGLLESHESSYPLYLGNNAYPAKISNVELVEVDRIDSAEEITISSIFDKNIIEEKYDFTENDLVLPYDLIIYAPEDINKLLLYTYNWFEFTNLMIDVKNEDNLYTHGDEVLYFM